MSHLPHVNNVGRHDPIKTSGPADFWLLLSRTSMQKLRTRKGSRLIVLICLMIREPTGCAKIKMLRRSLCGFMVIICAILLLSMFSFFVQMRRTISTHDADVIIGGGYCVPADIGHLKFTASIAEKAGAEMAVLMPTYDLAPQASYPRQLTQGVEILRYLITELGRKPENIILAGDSAGQFRKLLLWQTKSQTRFPWILPSSPVYLFSLPPSPPQPHFRPYGIVLEH